MREVASVDPALNNHILRAKSAPNELRSIALQQAPPPLTNIFRAYCTFLQRKRWRYDTGEGAMKKSLTEEEVQTVERNIELGIPYSGYLFPDKPILNCYDASNGFIFAMREAGIKKSAVDAVWLVERSNNYRFAYRGHSRAVGVWFRVRYDHLPPPSA
jgi:hypothetical protein